MGKNFNLEVNKADKDVFVLFYTRWCTQCRKTRALWKNVAKELEQVPDLVIAQFDAQSNEVEGLSIKGYPTIKLYGKETKAAPVHYNGITKETTVDEIKAFLKDKSTAYKRYLETKSDL